MNTYQTFIVKKTCTRARRLRVSNPSHSHKETRNYSPPSPRAKALTDTGVKDPMTNSESPHHPTLTLTLIQPTVKKIQTPPLSLANKRCGVGVGTTIESNVPHTRPASRAFNLTTRNKLDSGLELDPTRSKSTGTRYALGSAVFGLGCSGSGTPTRVASKARDGLSKFEPLIPPRWTTQAIGDD
ncbi:hypothetical protein K443DRAFT_354648 [Laccaria amethystina LaAM-08-1]|uniref:Uncharacterized protein n=1 Tax=Laccaria amethystina LaAM-08-1 TaxID=1095629 RepID=A0A0C9X012_9AGAR|nr:hypothetical protein K443DRAFT_354648 [Laccaria amethystina LaAM-08-1]